MFIARHVHLEVEMLKWLALMALAAALATLMVSSAGGSERIAAPEDPDHLPMAVDQWDQPMTVDPALASSQPDELSEWNEQLRVVLRYHRNGHIEEAIEGWNNLPLPCETEVWRHVGLAAAHLQTGNADSAAEQLNLAVQLEPENAVVRYYLGILRLLQAERAPHWYDATGPDVTRLVSFTPLPVSPNNPGMYELTAMMELQRAIELAPLVERDQMLISPDWADYSSGTIAVLPPIVEDVLIAIGADNFEGKSHNMLSYLCLDRGLLKSAEQHMDAASELGLSIVYGYEDLGGAYEQQGMYTDATRSYLKAMARSGDVMEPGRRAWQSFRKAFENLR